MCLKIYIGDTPKSVSSFLFLLVATAIGCLIGILPSCKNNKDNLSMVVNSRIRINETLKMSLPQKAEATIIRQPAHAEISSIEKANDSTIGIYYQYKPVRNFTGEDEVVIKTVEHLFQSTTKGRTVTTTTTIKILISDP